jgi:FixJ family two-component response regulator
MSEPICTVFMIDDDVSIRHAVCRLIRSIGLQVELFGSAREFLNRKMSEILTHITLDIRLLGISGLELQEHLAEAPQNSNNLCHRQSTFAWRFAP